MEGIIETAKEFGETLFEGLGTVLGYFFRMVLLIIVALVYLPSFLLTTALNEPFEKLLKEFGL